MIDTMTVIRSRHLRLAKTIYADGKVRAYDKVKTIDLFEMPIADLDAIGVLLARLLPQPSCAVVFGGVADPKRMRRVRRLAYPDPETGDLPSLRAIPHLWGALDMDSVPRSEGVAADDLLACAAEAIQRLPAAFHGVRCIVQASASHGIKPGCRMRLWFWLSRYTTGEELGFWLKNYPVDPCTFRTAQPIFTAAPVFVGRSDHLPFRLADQPGAPCVEVPPPVTLQAPKRASASPADRPAANDGDAEAFITSILQQVRSAPENAKHYRLRDMARLLGGIQEQVGFSDAEAMRWLVDALPSTALDVEAAKDTAEWGLDRGRAAPVHIPRVESRGPDPRRKAAARAAFRLLKMDVPSDVLLATLHDINEQQDDPLPAEVIDETVIWAARQVGGLSHAR